ncbi:hypothetical protein BJ508DRAFT_307330 [Ascobolus immersus RN42]|uniref:Uncharacterized protein n=1 Tax=Ascobolus immersus RN42 TaxID=1160509 RepID=A0A3N4I327_ASCIM|nr:hypothetical protein BJ508DRAFT_307330 [Ascobolus immersus RN42]
MESFRSPNKDLVGCQTTSQTIVLRLMAMEDNTAAQGGDRSKKNDAVPPYQKARIDQYTLADPELLTRAGLRGHILDPLREKLSVSEPIRKRRRGLGSKAQHLHKNGTEIRSAAQAKKTSQENSVDARGKKRQRHDEELSHEQEPTSNSDTNSEQATASDSEGDQWLAVKQAGHIALATAPSCPGMPAFGVSQKSLSVRRAGNKNSDASPTSNDDLRPYYFSNAAVGQLIFQNFSRSRHFRRYFEADFDIFLKRLFTPTMILSAFTSKRKTKKRNVRSKSIVSSEDDAAITPTQNFEPPFTKTKEYIDSVAILPADKRSCIRTVVAPYFGKGDLKLRAWVDSIQVAYRVGSWTVV